MKTAVYKGLAFYPRLVDSPIVVGLPYKEEDGTFQGRVNMYPIYPDGSISKVPFIVPIKDIDWRR